MNSRDQEFAEKRQLFLTEQGYAYEIVEAGPWLEGRTLNEEGIP